MRPLACAFALALLHAGPAGALPLDLANPAPRSVHVRFETGSSDLAADLVTPHEAFGAPHLARFRSDGRVATLELAGPLLEGALGSAVLPGSASDARIRLEVSSGRVLAVDYEFDAPVFFAEAGPHRVVVAQDSQRAGGFVPSFRFCDAPPRCTPVAAEDYDPQTGTFVAIGTATVAGIGAAFSRTDAQLAEVPEPGARALQAAALVALAALRRLRARAPRCGLPRRARGLVAALAPLALLGAGGGSPRVAITAPADGVVVLGAAVEARVALWPSLSADRERLVAWLEAGLDAPEGATRISLDGAISLAPDGSSAAIAVAGLPPGRSRLRVERQDRRGRPRASDERVLDRGGFAGATGAPFGAGVRYESVSLLDASGAPRRLDLAVWYPTDAAEPAPDTPLERDLLARLDAPLHPGASALPFVLHSHGNCAWEGRSSFLLADLARAGFVAAAPAHAGNTVAEPGCDEGLGEAIRNRPEDLRATFSALLAWNEDPAWPLAGAIDPARLGAVGYSLGALSSVQWAATEPRLVAALLLAAPAFPTSVFVPLAIPVMVQGGSLDRTTPFEEQQRLYAGLAPPRFLVEIADAAHGNFGTVCHTPFDPCVPTPTPVAELHARMLPAARGFLGRYVARDLRWEALLVSAPGAALESER